MRRDLIAVGLALALAQTTAGEESKDPDRGVITPTAIAGETWKGPQFVQADPQGRAYVLRLSSFEVYPFLRVQGKLGQPDPLETLPDDGVAAAPVMGVAMSSSGEWITLQPPNRLRYFDARGQEQQLPLPAWAVESVGWWDDRPVVGVLPYELGGSLDGGSSETDAWDVPPVLLAYSPRRSAWEAVYSLPLEHKSPRGQRPWRSTLLAPGGKGDLWVVWDYRYQVAHINRGGKVLERFAVGGAEIDYRDRSVAHVAALKAQGRDPKTLPPQVANKKVRAAAARDGRLYLLTTAGDGNRPFTLDRYTPLEETLERVELTLSPYRGRQTLAAAKDGLILTRYRGTQGRFLISWEALDAAAWQPVDSIEPIDP